GDRIAGTDEFSDYPPAARALPKVGKMEPDLERIAALRPDLVIGIVAGSHPKLRGALDGLHIPLTIVSLERLGEVEAAMQQLGTTLDCPRRDEAVRALHAAIERQRRTRARKPRVLFLAWAEPLYAAGRETFVDDLYRLTGATNALEATGWPQLSLETLVAHPPDILLYARQPVGEAQIAKLLARGVRTEAVAVDENLFGRPGPRMTEAAATLNAVLDAWEAKQKPRQEARR
ncbi:MAG: iron transporter substrate-binding protein, partial [Acidobacteria bacterium]|nr:iron transporter substrate-binding protein [Acidobacteriota bacterium]